MNETSSDDCGLRERKRRQTRAAIHEAAVELVHAGGLDGCTIAEIAEQAGISQRTFFNYFRSKEDAVVGSYDDSMQAEEFARYLDEDRPAGDLFDEVLGLVSHAYQLSTGDSAVAVRRREIIMREPGLMGRQMERVSAIEDAVAGVVERRLSAGEQASAGEGVAEHAILLVQMTTIVLRHAFRRMLDAPELDLPAEIQRSAATLREVMMGVVR